MLTRKEQMQNEVYLAYTAFAEVQTRDLGWTAKDYNEADRDYQAAVQSFVDEFGESPAYEPREVIGLQFPVCHRVPKD